LQDEDFERAEKAILNAIGKVELKIQDAIEKEVDTLYHKDTDEQGLETKQQISQKANQAIEKGAKKVKETVDDHKKDEGVYPFLHSHYPFDWPHGDPHQDHRILHAVEAAEKAVMHAVEEEVNNIFHDLKSDHDPKTAKKAEKSLKEGVEKAKKKVDDHHEHRRGWLSEDVRAFEDYYYDLE
jgi:hypothetical protein